MARFGIGETADMASMSRAQHLPDVRSEPAPLGSKRDTPLARAEPLGDVGCISVRADLRKGKMLGNRSWERGLRKCREKQPCKHKGQ